jgi:RNA polymerase sigma-70 factor (ECF subfamily)
MNPWPVALDLRLTSVSNDAPSAAHAPLLARLRAGEAAAVAEVYDEHHAHVRAFGRRLLGDDAAAEDLVQEVFISLPETARRFEGQSSFRTFLIGIAVNRARHHVRAAARRRAAVERMAAEPLASRVRTPEEDAHRAELAAALWRALDALPLDQRVAFVLCEIEERSSAEAAEVARVPEATVRTRLFHARRKLRELLERTHGHIVRGDEPRDAQEGQRR